MIQASLDAGRSVFYKSTGSSMWPLVQSEDACTFHPIQAVTAKGGKFSIQKEASEIEVGDIVFCQVQPSQLFYAHIVHKVERKVERMYVHRPKYSIGNIQGRIDGLCYREHIFGILVAVQVFSNGQYYLRPHPKVRRWNSTAREGVGAGKGRSLERHGTRPLFAAAGGYSEQSRGA